MSGVSTWYEQRYVKAARDMKHGMWQAARSANRRRRQRALGRMTLWQQQPAAAAAFRRQQRMEWQRTAGRLDNMAA